MFERCLYFNTQNLARTVERLWTEEFKQYGLSPAHAYLLRLVLAEPGLLQRDIAQQLGLSKSTVTRFIDSLAERGYVSRKYSNSDGRESVIYPERKALALHKQLEASGTKLYKRMLAALGEETMQSAVAQQRKIREALEG